MSEFGKWRVVFWPIYKHELRKFLPMSIMLFCILFNYSILRSIKDSLIVTSIGAEVIPALKLWFVLPAAILFVAVYSKLVNSFKKHTVFFIVVLFFVVYFIIFAAILYPNHHRFHNFYVGLPGGFRFQYLEGLLKPLRVWTFSSFYTMAELWGSTMIGLMFWRFANDVTSLKESRRFYTMFGLIANAALIFAGLLMKVIKNGKIIISPDRWAALPILITSVVVSSFIILGLYYYLTNYVLKDQVFKNLDRSNPKKEKPSLIKSLKYISKSKYLRCIVLLVICYGTSINLVEVVWKGQLGLLYQTKAAYSAFMGNLQILTGIVSILCMVIGSNILRTTSWRTAALITPIVISSTGLIFFTFIMFKEYLNPVVNILNPIIGGTSALGIVVFVGLIQNCTVKGIKYSLFDPTKEMSYIPLNEELRSKGKAVVDVVGSSAGKSGGSLILYLLLNVLFVGSSLAHLTQVIVVLFSLIAIIWFSSVLKLNKKFLAITTIDKQ
jgi:AAA family ATP:ADP antiporter